jgi:ubiquinone/menaquinone biosynthesis C-methylase UbiE
MSQDNTSIEAHYTRAHLFETILEALQREGIDRSNVTRKDIAGIDEFHVRGAEVTRELADAAGLQKGWRVLDVGSGLGGPCRLLAAEYGCDVTGIDLTAEYVRTATLLSELVGLNNNTRFITGSALDLPFADNSFDMVWTQHVQMNISDKQRLYNEIARVLTGNGQFVYYDIFSNNNQQVYYPTPWAAHASQSHLITVDDYQRYLQQAGLTITTTVNQTEKGIQFFDRLFERLAQNKLPAVGLNLIVGDTFKERFSNLHRNLQEGRLSLWSGTVHSL